MTFDGTPGWRAALQEFVDMNASGCFQPGVSGTSGASAHAQFALGRGLIDPSVSTNKGVIDAGSPAFSFSYHPFPGGTAPGQTTTFINIQAGLSVNAHSSSAEPGGGPDLPRLPRASEAERALRTRSTAG